MLRGAPRLGGGAHCGTGAGGAGDAERARCACHDEQPKVKLPPAAASAAPAACPAARSTGRCEEVAGKACSFTEIGHAAASLREEARGLAGETPWLRAAR